MPNPRPVQALCFLFCFHWALGQSIPVVQSGLNLRKATIPPGISSALVDLEVDGIEGDTIDVVKSDARLRVSLILPNGSEVTAANPFGFTIAEGSTEPEVQSLAPGVHTIFRLPGNPAHGIYKIKVDSTLVSQQSTVSAAFYSRGPIRVGVAADRSVYRQGQGVVLSLLMDNGSSPLSGMSIQSAYQIESVPESVSVFLQLQSRTSFNQTTDRLVYTARIDNTGPALQGFRAIGRSRDSSLNVVSATLTADAIAANSVVVSSAAT